MRATAHVAAAVVWTTAPGPRPRNAGRPPYVEDGMRKFLGGMLAGTVVGAVVVLVVVVVGHVIGDARTPAKAQEVCHVDPTASGIQGWCVQARHRDAGLFSAEVDQLWVVARQDGADVPRYTYVDVPDYAFEDTMRAEITDEGITVHLAEGLRVSLPASLYALD